MDSGDLFVSKKDFNKNLNTRSRKNESSFFITRTKYNKLISQVRTAKKKSKGELHPKLANLVKKYDVITCDGVDRLAVPNSTKTLIYLAQDELFSVIHQAHCDTGHGKLPEVTKVLKAKFKNVSNEAIQIYLKLCQNCLKKPQRKSSKPLEEPKPERKSPRAATKRKSAELKEEDESKENKVTEKNEATNTKKRKSSNIEKPGSKKKSEEPVVESPTGEVPAKVPKPKIVRRPKPVPDPVSSGPMTSGMRTPQRIDFIEMINYDGNDYNLIVVLRESTTKFVHLRPMRSRRPEELAEVLLPIFLCFGTPCSLISSNPGFVQQALEAVYVKNPTVPTDVMVEEASEAKFFADIETLMLAWVCENTSERWYNGLRFVQYIANLTYNAEIEKTPFEAMFGRKGKLDVSKLNLPPELIYDLRPEEDPEEEVKDVEINEMLEVVLNDED